MTTTAKPSISYLFAESQESISTAKKLIIEYANSLGCSPCLRNIEKELASFPLPFAPPDGRLLLAMYDNQPAGILGVRKVSDTSCEMARLYIKPQFRGKGLGKFLAQKGLEVGRMLGCRSVRLYTLPTMAKALTIYRRMGFKEIAPYTDNPIEGAFYLQINT